VFTTFQLAKNNFDVCARLFANDGEVRCISKIKPKVWPAKRALHKGRDIICVLREPLWHLAGVRPIKIGRQNIQKRREPLAKISSPDYSTLKKRLVRSQNLGAKVLNEMRE